jgi:hypothetical protein
MWLFLNNSYLLLNINDHAHGHIRDPVADGMSSPSASRSINCLVQSSCPPVEAWGQWTQSQVRREVLQDRPSQEEMDTEADVKKG